MQNGLLLHTDWKKTSSSSAVMLLSFIGYRHVSDAEEYANTQTPLTTKQLPCIETALHYLQSTVAYLVYFKGQQSPVCKLCLSLTIALIP